MFRRIARIKQKLSDEESIELLKREKRGVLSVLGDDDYPYGVPINHYYREADGKIYFHGGKSGHKLDAMRKHDKASFCVYDEGYRNEGEWWLNIKSVIVFGRIEFIEDHDFAITISRELSHKFTQDEDYIDNEVMQHGAGTLVFALVPEHITGKCVHER